VAACSIVQPTAVQAFGLEGFVLADEVLEAATAVRDVHASDLLGHPEVLAVGVGLSYDHPGEPALLLFVAKGVPHGGFPASIDGVLTRIVEVESMPSRGLLTAEASALAERSGERPPFVTPISESEVERAQAVHRARVAELMARRGVQAVGISSSADAPGEAALIVFVVKGLPRDPLPLVLDGLRTRVRESGRFRAK
jgi:hypothetical protein